MWPVVMDDKQVLLTKLVMDLGKLKAAAEKAQFDGLAFQLAQAENEARGRLETLEAEVWSH